MWYMKTHVEMSEAAKITMYITPLFQAFFVIIPISCRSQGCVCVCMCVCVCVQSSQNL